MNLPHPTPLKNLKYEDEVNSFSHELPYWEIFDDVIVFTDGSLGKAYRLKGIDLNCLDHESINDIAQKVRNFLNNLPENINLQFIVNTDSNYDDLFVQYEKGGSALSSYLSKKRLSFLKDLQNKSALKRHHLYLFLRYEPLKPLISKFRFFDHEETFKQKTNEAHRERVLELNDITLDIEKNLRTIGVEVNKLSQKEITSYLYQFFNHTRSKELPAPILGGENQAEALDFTSPREKLLYSTLSF